MSAAAAVLAERAPALSPRLGIVLGSGLGGLADALEDAVEVAYGDLPDFPALGVAGHEGRVALGRLGGLPVACLRGRAHMYERGDCRAMAAPVRTLKALGVEALLVTSAAGSLREDVGPGRLMAISDHINLMGCNPLVGPNDEAIGPRFPSLLDAYDAKLRARLHAAARAEAIDLAEGVYLAICGPSFETPAEIRAFRTLGADAIGMSTVPEVVLARHCGLRVAAVSAIVNLAEGMSDEPLTHEQTLRAAQAVAGDLRRLVTRLAADWS